MPTEFQHSGAEESEAEIQSFQAILEHEVPKGRDGKHKRIVTRLFADIDRLKPRTALKVPLAALPDSKENIRSALNRASHQKRRRSGNFERCGVFVHLEGRETILMAGNYHPPRTAIAARAYE